MKWLYDALCTWCREGQDATHDGPPLWPVVLN